MYGIRAHDELVVVDAYLGVKKKRVPIIRLMMYYCVRKLSACIVSLQHSFHVL